MRFSTEKTVAIKSEKRKKGEEPQLTLHGSRVQVRESTRYLGLMIDKRLNWKDHLRAKCTSSVNLIKHVSHLSWGADRKTLQRLYTTLVQSKLDYGAQVYGESKSNMLKRLEPIQNACLRAITGAFPSSPTVSLCVETGMLPLDFSRDMLTLKHFFKIQSLPNSPTQRSVIGPLGGLTPRMEHINELCTQYQVQTPKMLTNVVTEIPSWTYPPIRICPFLETKKQGLLDEEMRAIFLAHQERHPTVHIYADGSKSTEGVGFAAVFPNTTSGGRLTGEASIFTAELYAICAAVHEILKGTIDGNRYTIFSDSRSALLALRSDSPLSPILVETKELIRRAEEDNNIIDLCWVPGHVNVRGNEKADAALRAPTAPHKAIPHTDMRRPLREAITNGWHRKWNFLAREGRKLREIKKDVKDWTSSHKK